MAITDNIISYWKLNEDSGNATDSVGSNTLTNTNVTYSACKINNWAVFNATAKLVSSSNTPNSLPFSISFWFNLSAKPTSNLVNLVSNQSSVYNWWFIDMYWSWWVLRSGYANNTTLDYALSNFTLWVWYHYVGIFKSTWIYVYINSILVAKTDVAQTYTPSTWVFALWVRNSDWDRLLNGKMDEVGTWSRELTGTVSTVWQTATWEIAQLYNGWVWLTYPFWTANTTNFFQFM